MRVFLWFFMPIYQKIGLTLLIIGFFLSLTSIPNAGSQAGIVTPYNIAVYAGMVSFILFTIFRAIQLASFRISSLLIIPTTFVAVFYLLSFANSSWQVTEYFFYAILIGLLFLLSVIQYEWEHKHWFWFFYCIVLLGLLQVVISLVQRFDSFAVLYWWTGYFPFKFNDGYLGSLQQRNMLASFLAFAQVVSIWLILNKYYSSLNWYAKLILWVLLFLGSFVIFTSGSRAGMFGFLIGSVLIFLSQTSLIKQGKFRFILILVTVSVAALLALNFPADFTSGVTNKIIKVVDGADRRLFLYESGLAIFLQNFWFGVGIGNYTVALQEHVISNGLFMDSRIVNYDISRFTHPHNELLFWLIQIGFVGCLPIILGALFILRNWWQQGINKFLLYSGLSFPLVLQTMVSYPLILSATHYFLLLIFLAFSIKTSYRTMYLKIQPGVRMVSVFGFFLALIWVSVISYAALMSVFETYYFKNRMFLYKTYPEMEQQGYFYYASKWNLMDETVLRNMENMFLMAKKQQNFYDLKQYLFWFDNLSSTKNMSPKYLDYAKEARLLLEK